MKKNMLISPDVGSYELNYEEIFENFNILNLIEPLKRLKETFIRRDYEEAVSFHYNDDVIYSQETLQALENVNGDSKKLIEVLKETDFVFDIHFLMINMFSPTRGKNAFINFSGYATDYSKLIKLPFIYLLLDKRVMDNTKNVKDLYKIFQNSNPKDFIFLMLDDNKFQNCLLNDIIKKSNMFGFMRNLNKNEKEIFYENLRVIRKLLHISFNKIFAYDYNYNESIRGDDLMKGKFSIKLNNEINHTNVDIKEVEELFYSYYLFRYYSVYDFTKMFEYYNIVKNNINSFLENKEEK